MRLMGKLGLLAALCLASTGAVNAEEAVKTETATLGTSAITLHLHPFLTEEELTVLRLVLVNEDALKMFVVSNSGHAALAVAPDEGFVRDGALVPSAKALADLPDPETARTDALKACDEARKGDAACVVVLEIAPAG